MDSLTSGQTVRITDVQADFAADLVRSGQYQDLDDVVRAGLRLLAQTHAEDARRLAYLDAAVAAAEADLAAGRYTEIATDEDLNDFMASFDRPA